MKPIPRVLRWLFPNTLYHPVWIDTGVIIQGHLDDDMFVISDAQGNSDSYPIHAPTLLEFSPVKNVDRDNAIARVATAKVEVERLHREYDIAMSAYLHTRDSDPERAARHGAAVEARTAAMYAENRLQDAKDYLHKLGRR